jgi:hypothetical protein
MIHTHKSAQDRHRYRESTVLFGVHIMRGQVLIDLATDCEDHEQNREAVAEQAVLERRAAAPVEWRVDFLHELLLRDAVIHPRRICVIRVPQLQRSLGGRQVLRVWCDSAGDKMRRRVRANPVERLEVRLGRCVLGEERHREGPRHREDLRRENFAKCWPPVIRVSRFGVFILKNGGEGWFPAHLRIPT